METEILEAAGWVHAAAANNRVGGVTLAVHPIMARYTEPATKANDPRRWGRLKEVIMKGRKKKTLIIGTYAPSKNEHR